MTKILGIDPGKTTGWAVIYVEDKRISLGKSGQTKDMTLVDIKEHLEDADVIVYEGFWTRPTKARQGAFDWDQMTAPQVIGSLLTLCRVLGIQQVVKQQPAQKVPGYGFSGLRYVKGKQGQHMFDALAHAVFYAVTQLQCRPVNTPS